MPVSLRYGDTVCQRSGDYRSSARLRWVMAHDETDRKALGARLASARKLAGLTMDAAAAELTARGYPLTKQGLGHWESGRNVPDAMWLRRLAKLYGTTLDALVWDDALTIDAIRFAAQYDALNDQQQRAFRAMWLAYFAETSEAGEDLPPAPQSLGVVPGTGKQHQPSEFITQFRPRSGGSKKSA